MLRDGFFHADPHPGNVMVQPGPRLVLLDFGLAKDFPPRFRDGIVRLTFSILSADNARYRRRLSSTSAFAPATARPKP